MLECKLKRLVGIWQPKIKFAVSQQFFHNFTLSFKNQLNWFVPLLRDLLFLKLQFYKNHSVPQETFHSQDDHLVEAELMIHIQIWSGLLLFTLPLEFGDYKLCEFTQGFLKMMFLFHDLIWQKVFSAKFIGASFSPITWSNLNSLKIFLQLDLFYWNARVRFLTRIFPVYVVPLF